LPERVQDALPRAVANIDSYKPRQMSAWLSTILRSHFSSECRKRGASG
jgi:DNA-directed RNA polymerase specialized sigma24 family protein